MNDTPRASTDPTSPPAARSVRAWVFFAATFAVGLAADLISKALAFDWVMREAPITGSKQIIPGVLRFTLSTNPGIVFGMDWIPRAAVVAVTVAALGLVVYLFAVSSARARVMHIALGLILAGAVGNLYDRLFAHVRLPGRPTPSVREVRDFIDFSPLKVGPLNYPWIFNIADALLVIGVGILLVLSVMQWRQDVAAAKAERKT